MEEAQLLEAAPSASDAESLLVPSTGGSRVHRLGLRPLRAAAGLCSVLSAALFVASRAWPWSLQPQSAALNWLEGKSEESRESDSNTYQKISDTYCSSEHRLAHLKDATEAKCREECNRNSRCVGYEMLEGSDTCFLKANCDVRKPSKLGSYVMVKSRNLLAGSHNISDPTATTTAAGTTPLSSTSTNASSTIAAASNATSTEADTTDIATTKVTSTKASTTEAPTTTEASSKEDSKESDTKGEADAEDYTPIETTKKGTTTESKLGTTKKMSTTEAATTRSASTNDTTSEATVDKSKESKESTEEATTTASTAEETTTARTTSTTSEALNQKPAHTTKQPKPLPTPVSTPAPAPPPPAEPASVAQTPVPAPTPSPPAPALPPFPNDFCQGVTRRPADNRVGCSDLLENCISSRCCLDSSLFCVEKNPEYGLCMRAEKCTPGIVNPNDKPSWRTPWSCRCLG